MTNIFQFRDDVDFQGNAILNCQFNPQANLPNVSGSTWQGIFHTATGRVKFSDGVNWNTVPFLEKSDTITGLWTFNNSSQPFAVGNSNKVLNLNADLLDGYHASLNADSNSIALRDSAGRLKVSDPQSSDDAATKAYVDNFGAGLIVHDPVSCATTSNISDLSNASVVIDGYTCTTSDRILVKDQANQTQNGVYKFSSINNGYGQLVRCAEEDSTSELQAGTYVMVANGSTNAGTSWVQQTKDPTIGTSAIIWKKFYQALSYTAGSGLGLVGTEFSVILDSSKNYTSGRLVVTKSSNSLGVLDIGTNPAGRVLQLADSNGTLSWSQFILPTGSIANLSVLGTQNEGTSTFSAITANADNTVLARASGQLLFKSVNPDIFNTNIILAKINGATAGYIPKVNADLVTLVNSNIHLDSGTVILDQNNSSIFQIKRTTGTKLLEVFSNGNSGLKLYDIYGTSVSIQLDCDNPSSFFRGLNVGGNTQFSIDTSGQITKINNLSYTSWPSSHNNGVLKNDGSGNLTWTTLDSRVYSGSSEPLVGSSSGSSGYIAKFLDNDTITNSLIFDNGSTIGIGKTSGLFGKLHLFGGGLTIEWQDTNIGGFGIIAKLSRTITSSGSYDFVPYYFTAYKSVASGISDNGYMTGCHCETFAGHETPHNGTINIIYASAIYTGIWGTNSTGTINNVFGVIINPYCQSGVINNLYELYLNGLTSGGTVTNFWGIYQADANAKNYFAGNVGFGVTNPTLFKAQFAGHIGPNLDNTYNLGSSSYKWANLYVTNITASGTVSITGQLSKINNVSYAWPGANAAGILRNDGSGNLSWDTTSYQTALTFTTPLTNSGGVVKVGGLTSYGTANQLLGMNAGASGFEYKTLTGTADKITVTHSIGEINLDIPNPTKLIELQLTGQLSKINNVSYAWPGANAAGILRNDGSGNLSWDTTSYQTALTFYAPLINTSGAVKIGGLTSFGTANQILGMNSSGSGCEFKTISGTTDRISVSHSAGVITLDIPNPTRLYNLELSGQLSKINGVSYIWPSANNFGVLCNDGNGSLSWKSTITNTPLGARIAQIWVHNIPTSTWNGTNTEYTYNHNLNTTELSIVIQSYENNQWVYWFAGYKIIDNNNVYIMFTPPPAAGAQIRLLTIV